MQTETMNVTGMTCGGCVSKVTQALTALPGVGHVDVALPGSASVEFDEKLTSREHSSPPSRVPASESRKAQPRRQARANMDAAADLLIGVQPF
jgi:copper chaperone